jgi:DNA-binding NarL/FixJ family response regulator
MVDLLEVGEAALADGDWVGARAAFGELVGVDETADSLSGLATAHWWLGDIRDAFSCWERAFAASAQADPVRAARVAVRLAVLYDANAGNPAVAKEWVARAVELSLILDDPVVTAWTLVARGAAEEDPLQVAAWAERILRAGQDADDRDLQLHGLSMWGSALIDLGRVTEGAAMLDEALAGALAAQPMNLDTVVFAGRMLMQSCVRGADFLRVVQWIRSLADFMERYGCPYLHAICRSSYGAVLVATGDWVRAETELAAAGELAGDSLPAVQAEVAAYLADLRLAQGRVDEARRLLAGYEDRLVVRPILTAAHLAAGDTATAVAMARRQLDNLEGRYIEESCLREVLGEAYLAGGDFGSAADEGRHLATVGVRADSVLIKARAERLLGRALLAAGDNDAAQDHLAAADAQYAWLEMPLEVARTRLAQAVAMSAEQPESAVEEALVALTVFEDLGAARDADAAATWLESVGATAGRKGPRGLGVLTKRERDVLGVLAEGLSNPEIAASLYLSRRTVEHHVASVLSKLGLQNRTEAAAYVAHHLVEK